MLVLAGIGLIGMLTAAIALRFMSSSGWGTTDADVVAADSRADATRPRTGRPGSTKPKPGPSR